MTTLKTKSNLVNQNEKSQILRDKNRNNFKP